MTGIMATNAQSVNKGGSKNQTAAGRKRLRAEELSAVPVGERLYYCTMLPVEYLLRLLASLPLLVSHYHILCGASRLSNPSYNSNTSPSNNELEDQSEPSNPTTAHNDLWEVASKILAHISENSALYITPDSRYASLIMPQD